MVETTFEIFRSDTASKCSDYPPRADVKKFGQIDEAGDNSCYIHVMKEDCFFFDPGRPAFDSVRTRYTCTLKNLRNHGFVRIDFPLKPNKETIQKCPQEYLKSSRKTSVACTNVTANVFPHFAGRNRC